MTHSVSWWDSNGTDEDWSVAVSILFTNDQVCPLSSGYILYSSARSISDSGSSGFASSIDGDIWEATNNGYTTIQITYTVKGTQYVSTAIEIAGWYEYSGGSTQLQNTDVGYTDGSCSYNGSTGIYSQYMTSLFLSPTVGFAVIYPVTCSISPSSTSIVTGGSQEFTVTASDGFSDSYTYQWYVDGSAVSGATSTTYIYDESSGDHSIYCIVTDANGNTAQSNTAQISETPVSAALFASSIYLNVGQVAMVGVNVSSGSGQYKYQWYKGQWTGSNPATTETNITSPTELSGATGIAYLFYPKTSGKIGFCCDITDTIGGTELTCDQATSPYSSYIGITVFDPIDIAFDTNEYSIVSYGTSGNDTLSLTPTISGGSGSFDYQWYDNGSTLTDETTPALISGSTTDSLTYSSTNSILHSVYLELTDTITGQVVISPVVLVDVSGGMSASINPASFTGVYGDRFTITAIVTNGSGEYTINWYGNSTNSTTGGTLISSNGGDTYTELASSSSYAYYYFIVTDNVTTNSVTSTVFTLDVIKVQSSVLTSNFSAVAINSPAVLTLKTYNGSGNFTYDWVQVNPDGTQTDLGNQGSSYAFSSSTTGTYSFFAVITDTSSGMIITSNMVTVIVSELAVTFVQTPNPTSYGVQFTVFATASGGSSPYTYSWLDTNTSTVVSTSSSLTTSVSEGTTYTLTLTDSDGATQDFSYTLVINSFTVEIATTATSLLNTVTSQEAVLSVSVNPLSGATYQWYLNGNAISGATSSSYTFAGKGETVGTYSFYCAVTESSVTIDSDTVDIEVTDAITFLDSGNAKDIYFNVNGAETKTTFNVYVADSQIKAYNIRLTRSLNSAGELIFRTAGITGQNISIGQTVQFYYRGKIMFTGLVTATSKYSTYEYDITCEDGLWELAAISDDVVTDSVSALVQKYSAMTSMDTSKLTGTEITQVVTVDFGGKSIFQKLQELLYSFGYNIVADETNAVRLLNFSNSQSLSITENVNFVVYSKQFNPVSQYGSVEIVATIDGNTYTATSGSGTPSRVVGDGWLSLPTGDQSVLRTMADTILNVLSAGDWNIQLITFGSYVFYQSDTNGNPYTYDVKFSDGSSLKNLQLTGISIQNNGVQITLQTYSDVLINLFNSLVG